MTQKKAPKSRVGKKKKPIVRSRADEEEEETSPSISSSSKFPRHKHCNNCGVSISPDSETCSTECQAQWEKMLSRKKFWTYLPIIASALLILFMFLIYGGG